MIDILRPPLYFSDCPKIAFKTPILFPGIDRHDTFLAIGGRYADIDRNRYVQLVPHRPCKSRASGWPSQREREISDRSRGIGSTRLHAIDLGRTSSPRFEGVGPDKDPRALRSRNTRARCLSAYCEAVTNCLQDIAPHPKKLGSEAYRELMLDLQDKAEGLLFGTTPAQVHLQHEQAGGCQSRQPAV